jgi:hypothetical protein
MKCIQHIILDIFDELIRSKRKENVSQRTRHPEFRIP